jgi:hypothetical protein
MIKRSIPHKILRRMGFQSESQGLFDRYVGVNGAWDEHLDRCRKFITGAVQGKKIDHLAVLGSGWLLDLPMEVLVEVAGHVWLYDAVHPSQVLHQLRKYGNVTTISADITGGCLITAWKAVKQFRRKKAKTLPDDLCRNTFQPEVIPDMVVSLNILSQIGVMITSYLKKHIPYTREEIERINLLLQQAHLDSLPRGKTCLITDIRENNIDLSSGLQESVEPINAVLPVSPHRQTWEWQFDPFGGYNPGKKTIMQVVAMEF